MAAPTGDDDETDRALEHLAVMASEVVDLLLDPDPEGDVPRAPRRFIDGTVGGGGHARAILAALEEAGAPMDEVVYLGIDRDPDALRRAEAAIDGRGARVILEHGRMSEMEKLARQHGIDEADGILLDLGVSSFQLDDEARGFSFRGDSPLDMRMDTERDIVTARDLVNQLDEETLATIIHDFGEERFARRIAAGIVHERSRRPIATSAELSAVVARSVPARHRHGRMHVATRTFQALRIAVNHELDELTSALGATSRLLAPRGRLVIISFHSLEDRPVKEALRARADVGELRLLGRKVRRPTEEEVARNPRARSAKLRAAERPHRRSDAA